MTDVTPAMIRRANAMRAEGVSWTEISATLRIRYRTIRAACEPEWAEKNPEAIGRVRGDYREHRPLYDPSRDGPATYASLSARLLGDPPIGRRAIDRKSA